MRRGWLLVVLFLVAASAFAQTATPTITPTPTRTPTPTATPTAVTTLYLGDDPPDVYPAVDSGWESRAADVRWASLYATDGNTSNDALPQQPMFAPAVNVSNTTTDDTIEVSLVSPPMDSGVVFTNGVTTVTMSGHFRELATNDDVNECIIGLRVMSNDVSSTLATLLPVANYHNTNEFSSTGRVEDCAIVDPVQADYTTTGGERLVLEVGYSLTVAGTSPQANVSIGRHYNMGTPKDCVNGVETATSNCYPWIGFSNSITFAEPTMFRETYRYPSMAHFYFNSRLDHGSSIAPAYDGAWDSTSGSYGRRRLDRAMADDNSAHYFNGSAWHVSGAGGFGGDMFLNMTAASTNKHLMAQWISTPLAAGTVFDNATTRVWLSIQGNVQAVDDHVDACITSIRILDDDLTTYNATILTLGDYTADVAGSGEMPQTAANNGAIYFCALQQLISNDYTTVDGDRLVVEIGGRTAVTSVTPTNVHFQPGDGDGAKESVAAGTLWNTGWWAFTSSTSSGIWELIFSIAIPELDDGANTRMYFPQAGSWPTLYRPESTFTPAIASGWDESDGLQRFTLNLTDNNTALGHAPGADTTTCNDCEEALAQWVTMPLAAGAEFVAGWTKIWGQLGFQQFGGSEEIRWPVIAARIVSQNGAIVRAELLPMGGYYLTWNTSSFEFYSGGTYRNEHLAAFATTVQTTYTTVDGDRLVIELGARSDTGAFPPGWRYQWGETGTECGNDRTNTADCVGWTEVGIPLTLLGQQMQPRQPPWFAKYLMADPIGIVRTLRSWWREFVQ